MWAVPVAMSSTRSLWTAWKDAELICLNTDVRTLKTSTAHSKVQIGKQLTRGLGAGGDPELGILAAEEAEEEIRAAVRGQDMVFICTGLGGGTGSGAAPTVSRIAKEEGAFVVVFATMPFSFEGRRRIQQAETALKLLERSADALITFENDRMGELVLPKEGIQQAFGNADKIISQSVRGDHLCGDAARFDSDRYGRSPHRLEDADLALSLWSWFGQGQESCARSAQDGSSQPLARSR